VTSRTPLRVFAVVVAVCVFLAGWAVSVFYLAATGFYAIRMANGSTQTTLAVKPPLRSLAVERRNDEVVEVTAELSVPVDECINLSIFDGFKPIETIRETERRLGPPSGHWVAPPSRALRTNTRFLDKPTIFYDRPGGRVTLRLYDTPEQGVFSIPAAFPRNCALDDLFTDVSLRSQIAAVLPANGLTSLTVRDPWGYTPVVMSIGRSGCSEIQWYGPTLVGRPPLQSVYVRRDHGEAVEITAHLSERVDQSVNLHMFDGFEPAQTIDQTQRRLGPPSGRWIAPPWRGVYDEMTYVDKPTIFYERPGGRVTLRLYDLEDGKELAIPAAFPKPCTLDALFTNASLRSQIASLVPPERPATLELKGLDGITAVVIYLNRSGCSEIQLHWRAYGK
jgi:hypothetical protein